MSNSKLIELSYYDPSAQVRLSAYADTIVLDHDQNGSIISAIRFGGYPEMVRAMADAIYGGATIEAAQNDTTRMLQSSLKSYQRQITHDGIYAVATLMAADTVQEDDRSGKHEKDEDTNLVDTEQMELQPRRCYIFCPARDQKRLFEELDHKTAAPLIPEFQDYVLSSLRQRGDLRQLEVISLKERMDAWVLDLKPQDQNVVEVLEQGLQSGDIQIPGAVPNMPDVFENVENVTGYPTLKAVCEGRELPAYEAVAEFTAQTSGELDDLLSQLGGKPGAVQTLEKLEQAEKTAEDKLAALLEQLRGAPQDDPALSAAVVKAANDAESKRRQADAVNKLVDAGLAQNQAEAGALIARAVSAAAERAEEVQTILGAWSDAPGDMRKTDANAALLERVRDSKTLRDISRYLGRFREIFAQGKRNGYAYGRGEKYALELGNDLSRALTSELAMLAVPETLPLFLRKYQHRQIKQYRRREPVYKGAGDIICCLDESGSTAGDLAAWGKAVALTLLEIAQSEGRKFALVHFSGPGRFQTDVFLPGQSSLEEKLHAAETFLGGGTDFQTPLAEAERLMREGGFENADIAFITDGECSLPETCVEMLQKAQSELRFTVTGILLDEGNAGMDFSLKTFCQNIYRTSELTGDQIVREIVLDRV